MENAAQRLAGLIADLSDPDISVRCDAAEEIGKIFGYVEDPPMELASLARQALLGLLVPAEDPALVSTALAALGLIECVDDASTIARHLDDPDSRVRRQARWALEHLAEASLDVPRLFEKRVIGTWTAAGHGTIVFLPEGRVAGHATFPGQHSGQLEGYWFQPSLQAVTLELEVPEDDSDYRYIELLVRGRDADATLVDSSGIVWILAAGRGAAARIR